MRRLGIGPALFFFFVTISSSISEVAHDMQRICICALLVSVSLLIVAAEVRDSANHTPSKCCDCLVKACVQGWSLS